MAWVLRVQYAVMANTFILCTVHWFIEREPAAVAIGVAGITSLISTYVAAERRLAVLQAELDAIRMRSGTE